VLVAFMPWNGYNFEDSILISERIVRDDVFTSIHIEEFEVMARDTKLGRKKSPATFRTSEEALKNLDEAGIVYIGAEVEPGDILVGKITPKGESPMTPEEKLLRAIFGEKASDVRDTSLRLPPGVASVRSWKCASSTATASTRTSVRWRSSARKSSVLQRTATTNWRSSTATLWPSGRDADRQEGLAGPKGSRRAPKITESVLNDYPRSQWWQFAVRREGPGRNRGHAQQYDEPRSALNSASMDKVEKLQRGDELPPGVMKMVKVFVAVKRKIQPGDKMAGRHGNKGVVSPHRAGSRTCRSWKTAAGGYRAEPAWRAEPHERRSDPRNPPGLGLPRSRPQDRRGVDAYRKAGRHQAPLRKLLEDRIYGEATRRSPSLR
jgi:DNA-directed RNA polymerase subunit beta